MNPWLSSGMHYDRNPLTPPANAVLLIISSLVHAIAFYVHGAGKEKGRWVWFDYN